MLNQLDEIEFKFDNGKYVSFEEAQELVKIRKEAEVNGETYQRIEKIIDKCYSQATATEQKIIDDLKSRGHEHENVERVMVDIKKLFK